MRHYKKKTQRGEVPLDLFYQAAEEISNSSKSIRNIAKKFNICHVTLSRFMKRKQKQEEEKKQSKDTSLPLVGYYGSRQVFTPSQELKLVSYISKCAEMNIDLTPKDVRKLAYICAVKFELKIPKIWEENKSAGPDWFTSFMKRHPDLSLQEV